MVYCGKASLNCKNCRIRRIKCNRIEPECSQCVRAGKKCPGYRDQLALMFRDETVKLKRKFDNAPYATQTEQEAPGEQAEASSSRTPKASTRIPVVTDKAPDRDGGSSSNSSRSGGRTTTTATTTPTTTSTPPSPHDERWRRQQRGILAAAASAASALVPAPPRTPGDRGLQFYFDNYLYGHPESPGRQNAPVAEMNVNADIPWIFHPPARVLAEAVGMEGLANLTGNKQLKMEAWQGYIAGLRQTQVSLAHASPRAVAGDVRSIVLLAMFELARGNEPYGTANVHILGAAALMSKFSPQLPPSPQLFRGLMQMCFSLLIAYQAAGTTVPPVVTGFVSGMRIDTEDEQHTAALLAVLVDVINLSAYLRRHIFTHPTSDAAVHTARRLLLLDARMAAWQARVQDRPQWRVHVCHTSALPPAACYRGTFHRYRDIPTGRLWDYYRWARILLNEELLQFVDKCPGAVQAAGGGHGKSLLPLKQHARQVIRACAQAILESTPTHWRDPRVSPAAHALVASPTTDRPADRPSSGAVGVFPILFHLQVAACAPGTPRAAWQWAVGVVDTVWAQLGLEQARFLGSQMRVHRAALERRGGVDLVAEPGWPEEEAAQTAAPHPPVLCSPDG